MERDKCTPPPQNELPDYYLGRLIYHDELGDDNCRWVIYDGVHTIRFPSRAAAERYCVEVSLKIDDDVTQNLMRCYEGLRRSYVLLDKVADKTPVSHKLKLQQIALDVRKAADQLDGIIAQSINNHPKQ